MDRHFLNLVMISTALVLVGCHRTSETEARFLRDYRTVTELADTLKQVPRGYEFAFPHGSSVARPTDFQAVERNIKDYMHSSRGWEGNAFRQEVYRPVAGEGDGTNAPPDAAVLLEHYFGRLEQAGFTSGVVGFPKTAILNSMEVAKKSWSNKDRTLIVLGEIIRDRESGEIVASVQYWGTLNYRP